MFSVCAVVSTELSWFIRSWIVDMPSVNSAIAFALLSARPRTALQLPQIIRRDYCELHPRGCRKLIRADFGFAIPLPKIGRFLFRREPRRALHDHLCGRAPRNLGKYTFPAAVWSVVACYYHGWCAEVVLDFPNLPVIDL